MKTKKPKASDKLKDFLDFLADVNREYRFCVEKREEEDKRTQDLLHHLELNKTTASERNRIGKELTSSRRARRYYKDRIEELKPIIE